MSPTVTSKQAKAQAPTGVVYVVDDDVSVRESLTALIRSVAGWHPFGDADPFGLE